MVIGRIKMLSWMYGADIFSLVNHIATCSHCTVCGDSLLSAPWLPVCLPACLRHHTMSEGKIYTWIGGSALGLLWGVSRPVTSTDTFSPSHANSLLFTPSLSSLFSAILCYSLLLCAVLQSMTALTLDLEHHFLTLSSGKSQLIYSQSQRTSTPCSCSSDGKDLRLSKNFELGKQCKYAKEGDVSFYVASLTFSIFSATNIFAFSAMTPAASAAYVCAYDNGVIMT